MIQETLTGLAMLLDQRGVALYQPAADGGSIFLEFLPERAEHVLALTCYGGDLEPIFPTAQIRPRVQVMARGDKRSPRWSREACERVYGVLNGFQGWLPNGADVHWCWGLQSAAMSLGPDTAGRWMHSQNYELWIGHHTAVPMETRHDNDARRRRVLQPSGGQR